MNSQGIGKANEQALEWLHKGYKAHGLCIAWHNGTRAEHTGNEDNPWKTVESLPDFSADLPFNPLKRRLCLDTDQHKIGLSVHFDAKQAKAGSKKFSLHKDQAHQANFMWEAHQFGAICFFLVSVGKDSAYMLLPEPHWYEPRGWANHFSDENVIPVPAWAWSDNYLPDWYEVVRQMIENRFDSEVYTF